MSYRLEHRIGVPAPAEAIWEVLADIEAWPSWNPVYPQAQGKLRIGEKLSLTERAGGADEVIVPTIVDWVPQEQILWRFSRALGFLGRLRFIEIESLDDASCIFSNGEIWSGRAIHYTGRQRRRDLRQAYIAMGEALRDEVLGRIGQADRTASG